MKGKIIQSLSGYYDVVDFKNNVFRTRARGLFRNKFETPLVGDYVDFQSQDDHGGYLLSIYPRKNKLVRPPVSNVDYAVIVSSCVQPNFSINLLDRQLIMLASNGIEALLYFSKMDLANDKQLKNMRFVFDYYSRYYKCQLSNIKKNDFLLDGIKNKVIVVMGQTGAGKSTYLNSLNDEFNLPVGEVSKSLSRGKHTTRKIKLMKLNKNWIADTPGFSSFNLLKITDRQLPKYYLDFEKYSDQCKFRSCLHINEPLCKVKEEVQKNKIFKLRYLSYLQLHNSIIRSEKRIY